MESITVNPDQLERISLEKGKIYYIICIGLVSSGKSTLFTTIKDHCDLNPDKYSYFYISSDELRDKLSVEYQVNNPTKTEEECFEAVGKKTAAEFDNQIKLYTMSASSEKINIVLVDKNYPQGIEKFLNTHCKNKPENNIVIVLKPNTPNILKVIKEDNKKIYYPFSLSYIIQCFLRMQNRTDHQNLTGFNEKSYLIFFSFLKCYEHFNFKYDLFKTSSYNNVYLTNLTFTDEKNEIEVNDVHNLFYLQVVHCFKGFDLKNNRTKFMDKVNEYVQYIMDFYLDVPFDDTRETLKNEILDILENGLIAKDKYTVPEKGNKSKK